MTRTLRYFVIALLLMLFSALIYTIIYTFPRQQNIVVPVVIYQLEGDIVREAELRIDGTLKRSLFAKHSFHGYFQIYDDWFQIPEEYTYVELAFHEDEPSMFAYTIFSEKGMVNSIFVGTMFADSNFSTQTILLNYVEGKSTDWTSETGFILSAPASNREEAIKVTHELLQHYYADWNILSHLE